MENLAMLNNFIAAVKLQLNQMRILGWNCDVNFSCNGRMYPAHRTILLPNSELLQEKYGIDITDRNITVYELDPEHAKTINEVLNFIYLDETLNVLLKDLIDAMNNWTKYMPWTGYDDVKFSCEGEYHLHPVQ